MKEKLSKINKFVSVVTDHDDDAGYRSRVIRTVYIARNFTRPDAYVEKMGSHDEAEVKYATEEEALKGHDKLVADLEKSNRIL